MKLLLLLALAVTACSDQRDTELSFAPSPLASFDRDRDPDHLYLLVRAGGGVKPICRDYFAAPTSAATAAFSTECQAWQSMMLDHLRLNGISDLQAEHLEDPTFWRWWAEAQSAIGDCRTAMREQDRIRRETRGSGRILTEIYAFTCRQPSLGRQTV